MVYEDNCIIIQYTYNLGQNYKNMYVCVTLLTNNIFFFLLIIISMFVCLKYAYNLTLILMFLYQIFHWFQQYFISK